MANDNSKNRILDIKAREILDSRGYPTLEVELFLDSGKFTASVPSGTSKGKYEALELRDGGERYLGMGVLGAVRNVNEIIGPKLKGVDVTRQDEIDNFLIELDGTENKSKLGTNATLAVSIATLRAGAAICGKPLWERISEIAKTKPKLPIPCILFLEAGLHGKGGLDIQEVMVLLEADSFKERLKISTETYHVLGKILEKKYGKVSAAVGLEGAFSPQITELEEALDVVQEAILKAGSKKEAKIIIDSAASCFYQNGEYFFEGDVLSGKELEEYYLDLCNKYPIVGIEDPFAEDDWKSFQNITEALGGKIDIIGDDLLATNLKRIRKAAGEKACNALVLKPNQAGTVKETIEAAKVALGFGWKVFVKHRSGETKDDFISDLATGLGTGYIMAGAPTRGERVAKYNRLLKIEEEIKLK